MKLISNMTCARRIRAITIGIGVICLAHLSAPLYGQSSSTWGASPTWVTGANVGIGTTVPISLLDVRSANSVAPTVSIGLTSSSFPVQAVGSIAFGSLYPPNGAWYQAAGINGINEAAGDSSFGALSFLTRSSQTLAEKMRITSGGNVGMGTASPGANLDVQTSTPAQGTYQSQWWSTPNSGYALKLQTVWDANGIYQKLIQRSASTEYNVLTFFNGNVGIGTTLLPQSLLAVNGRITTREVVVTSAGWSDYVFEPNYHLTPLHQVAAYIKEHHHLPEIPSEAEVKEKGLDLGDMQAKLLAKVEELTLHMIQADERNNRSEQENRELRERIARLEAREVKAGAPVRKLDGEK